MNTSLILAFLCFVLILPTGCSQIGINVGADQTGTLGGIEPKVRWSTSGEVAGIDVAVSTSLQVYQEHPRMLYSHLIIWKFSIFYGRSSLSGWY